MSDHTSQRLETQGGKVVAYLAPTVEVSPQYQNDLQVQSRPDSEVIIARDLALNEYEIVFQGAFEHSDNLPEPHRNDLESMFGGLPVTPRDQANRVIDFAFQQLGPYELYDGDDEYTATTEGELDISSGVYPTVEIEQVRPSSNAGEPRRGFTIRLVAGFDSL